MKERKRIPFLGIFVVLILLVWYVGTFWLTTTNVEVYSDKIDNEFTIVHLTDLHGANFGTDNSLLIQKVDDAVPDIVCITGDMYTAGDQKAHQIAQNLMNKLSQKYPVYFINGEHDYNEDYFNFLENSNVNVINYEDQLIEVAGNTIRILGINNQYYSSTFNLENEFVRDEEHFNLLLAHASNFDKFSDFGVDLSLCGDTHGGQVRLPFIGAVYNRGIWFPELRSSNMDAHFTKGLYEMDDTTLFVSSGLGNAEIPVRFLNMPEVAVIKVKPTN